MNHELKGIFSGKQLIFVEIYLGQISSANISALNLNGVKYLTGTSDLASMFRHQCYKQ